MAVPRRIENAAVNRIGKAVDNIRHTVEKIEQGCPLDAEPQEQRKVERIAAVAKVGIADARRLARYEDPKALGLTGESLAKAEAIQGKTVDYLGVAWLEAGRIASRAVARILFPDGSANGTGFLISNRLLVTNNHVLADPNAASQAIVEFSYELALGSKTPNAVRFRLAPQLFFETDSRDDLDFSIVALGPAITPGATLAAFGACPLSASAAKHLVGEQVNVIEHPDGDYKQVVVRESRIVHRGDTVLHYLADTEPGSSGSPVFNDQWQTVALHHWGGPHRELTDGGGRLLSQNVNEGIRISCIIDELNGRISRLSAQQQAMLQEALNAPPAGDFGTRAVTIPANGPQSILGPDQPTEDGDSSMDTITTPITDALGEAAGGPPASRIDPKYSNRRGYNTRFLPGFAVNLPQLNRTLQKQAARIRSVGDPPNPFELKYEHFSVVVNAARRMPFFSICNIDGSKRIHVDRNTGKAVSQPEATENWAIDPRIPEEAQLSDAFYQRLRSAFRGADFFARGHMTRREDPDWGTAPSAEKANNDTFHHTNACPQVNTAFNASQKVWQGIENFILNSADDANLRVTVITGPVFADDDPEFDDAGFGPIRLPRRFWKIVARVEDGTPKVFAILADQSPFMNAVMKPAGGEAAEAAFEWPAKLSREFRSTIQQVTDLTGLDFGDLANHDVFATGEESLMPAEITKPEQLFPKPANEGAFGNYASIGDFLEAWETTRQRETLVEPEAEERRVRPQPQPPPQPQREVVEINAQIDHVFPDDLSGAKHQQFSVRITQILHADPKAQADVQNTKKEGLDVRLAVRFGDSLGLPDRIPGIRTGVALHIKGEWISAAQAGSVGGQHTAVLHFTHKPLGFICTPAKCYS